MEGYNMTTLMKRLEAATSRLEDLVAFQETQTTDAESKVHSPTSSSVPVSPTSVPGPEPQTPKTPSKPTAAAAPSSPGLDALKALSPHLAKLVELSKDISPLVQEQSTAFAKAASAMIEIVLVSLAAKKPDMGSTEFMELMQPLSSNAGEVVNIRDDNRAARELGNYLATLSEAVPALGWISVDNPGEYVKEFQDSAQFYGNRILKENKAHAPWVKALSEYLSELIAIVKKHYTKGLEWNPKGQSVKEVLATTSTSAPAATSSASSSGPTPAPPPPPPPPPSVEQLTAGLDSKKDTSGGSSEGGMSAVFSELSQGESITSGLKHVDRKAARANLPPKPALKPKAKPSQASSTSTTGASVKKPSSELVDKRWIIENYVGREDLVVEADMSQSVLIDNCKECVVHIKGKVATISVSRCTKTGVAAESLVAGIEVVKCGDFRLQVTGALPSLNIDQSHNGHVYLNENALDVDIYTAQSTSININVPTGEEGDWKEIPLAEQILHKVVNKNTVQSKAVTAGNI